MSKQVTHSNKFHLFSGNHNYDVLMRTLFDIEL